VSRGWTAFAIAFWVVAMIGGVGGLIVRVVDPAPIVPNTYGFGPAGMVAVAVFGMAWATAGAVLAIRMPANPIGRYMLVVGTGFGLTVLTTAVLFAAMASGTADGQRIGSVAAWLTALMTSVIGFIFYVGFIFPTGQGHTPGWHRVGLACFWILTVGAILVIFQPGSLHLFPTIDNPLGFGPDLRGFIGPRAIVGIAIATTASAVALVSSVIARYRAAGRIERQQLKLFIFAIVTALVGMAVLTVVVWAASGPVDEIGLVVFGIAAACVPVAIGIAILRYRLFEIDRLVSRTIAYALVTGGLVLVFVAVNLALTTAFSSLTNGNAVAVAASTLVVAASFTPLRRRVQQVVDRRFDRARYDADRTATAFSGRLRDEVDLTTLVAELDRTVQQAISPSKVGVWLRTEGRR
jgi:hypothetical protein